MNRVLIERTNALLKNLEEENKKYAVKLLSYIRTAGLFYNENEVEDLLTQILQDLTMAQHEGESAEQYFGKKPQDAADELIKNLGKISIKNSLKKIVKILGYSISAILFVSLSSEDIGINVLSLFLFALLGFSFNSAFYFTIHKGVYKKLWDSTISSSLFGVVITILLLNLSYAIFFLIPVIAPFFTIHPGDSVAIFILGTLMISETFLFIRNKEARNIRLAFLPFVWIWGGLGIAQRIPQGESWIANNEIIIIILLILGFTFGMLFPIITLLKEKKRQEELTGISK